MKYQTAKSLRSKPKKTQWKTEKNFWVAFNKHHNSHLISTNVGAVSVNTKKEDKG